MTRKSKFLIILAVLCLALTALPPAAKSRWTAAGRCSRRLTSSRNGTANSASRNRRNGTWPLLSSQARRLTSWQACLQAAVLFTLRPMAAFTTWIPIADTSATKTTSGRWTPHRCRTVNTKDPAQHVENSILGAAAVDDHTCPGRGPPLAAGRGRRKRRRWSSATCPCVPVYPRDLQKDP